VKKLIDHAKNVEGAALVDVMALLQIAVETHVADEEKNLLPKLQAAATPAQLDGLARAGNRSCSAWVTRRIRRRPFRRPVELDGSSHE
jgi:hypothetical protein